MEEGSMKEQVCDPGDVCINEAFADDEHLSTNTDEPSHSGQNEDHHSGHHHQPKTVALPPFRPGPSPEVSTSASTTTWNQTPSSSPGETPINNRDSEIIQQAIGSETRVVTGFQNIVRERRTASLKKKTMFRTLGYCFLLMMSGISLYIVDHYVPTKHLTLILPISIGVFVLVFIIWFIYRRWGKARWALNWRLKKTSRYLDVCQVSEEYVQQMLPKLGEEAQGVCHCRLAGSAGDGYGFFPALSANVGICHKEPPLTQDVDMNIFYEGLELDRNDIVTKGMPPGFCIIRLDSRLEFLNSYVHDCVVRHPNLPGLYLSGKVVSDKIGQYISHNVVYNYPAITYTQTLTGPQGNYAFDVDMVWGIKIPIWPEVAKDWPTSPERRLPRDMIDNIVQRGCYVVHKHCSTPIVSEQNFDHPDHSLDWRFTFAEAESDLFKFHGDKEALKLCYVIIKFVLKQYSTKKKKKFPALKSYHLKTLFLKIAEKESQFNVYNIKHNKDLGELFMYVLAEYRAALESKQLTHYFLPSVNILAPYTDTDLQEGIKVLKEFQNQPLAIIDAFDKAWISRKSLDLFFIIAFIAIFFCFGMKFFFEYRSISLQAEADSLFRGALEDIGKEHLDLAGIPTEEREKLLKCISEKQIIFDVRPDLVLKFCRLMLGYGLPTNSTVNNEN